MSVIKIFILQSTILLLIDMFKLLYAPVNEEVLEEVDVYDIQHTHNLDGELMYTFVLAWSSKMNSWITAPIYDFKPCKKILKEG